MSYAAWETFKALLLGFWGVYFATIAATNAFDLRSRQRSPSRLDKLRAHNLEEVEAAVAAIGGNRRVACGLFVAVIVAQSVGGVLSTGACLGALGMAPLQPWVDMALIWNVVVWQAFVVADTVCKTYQFTVVHTVSLGAAVLTVLCWHG